MRLAENPTIPCAPCIGTGRIEHLDVTGDREYSLECETCHGTGESDTYTCIGCSDEFDLKNTPPGSAVNGPWDGSDGLRCRRCACVDAIESLLAQCRRDVSLLDVLGQLDTNGGPRIELMKHLGRVGELVSELYKT